MLQHVPAPPPFVIQALLVNACARGQGAAVRWLVTRMGADIQANEAAAFRVVASCGDLDLVKWVWTTGPVDIRRGSWALQRNTINMTLVFESHGNHAFLNAVENGHLHIARWVAGLVPAYPPWPDEYMQLIKSWDQPRDAWMRAVVARA